MIHQALWSMQKWEAEYRRGKESLEDDPKFGRPATATAEENIDRVIRMMTDDKQLTLI